MNIFQTVGELGLDEDAMLVWIEPRRTRFLKPKYGAEAFPWRWILAAAVPFGFIAILVWYEANALTFFLSPRYWVISGIVSLGTVTVLALLDFLSSKDIRVYRDVIIRTHASVREVYPFADVVNAVVYPVAEKGMRHVLELVLQSGRSVPLGIPSEMETQDLMTLLRTLTVRVRDEL